MSTLHQPYTEVQNMGIMELRGFLEIWKEIQKASQPSLPKRENELDISDEDMDTSMWFT